MAKVTVELDHLSIPVKRYTKARKLYAAALGAIGMTMNLEFEDACGFGANGEKIFWLVRDKHADGGAHVALRVQEQAQVDAFHAAALKAGAEDNGPPGPRLHYGPNYYAAFVKDLEGNNLEVVCYAKLAAGKAAKKAKKKKAT